MQIILEELIEKILEIIKDYRKDDNDVHIDKKHILKWINQFNPDDREIVLNELLYILPNSYLTEENTLRIFKNEFEILSKNFGYKSVEKFLDKSRFIDCQKVGKSQKFLLEIIRKILLENYNYDIKQCGRKGVENWIYIDDVLASGGTFREDITEEIESFGVKNFKDSNIKIISSFFILHTWAVKNVPFAIEQKFKKDYDIKFEFKERMKFYRVAEIDNNPYYHHYFNSNPRFNHVYPTESEEGKEFLSKLETAFERDYELKNIKFAFRNKDFPKEENFFSSKENRGKYEKILLNKGLEIFYSIENLNVPSIRPLGMAPPSYQTLGTGSHFFTWRNISNTCPLVFWWESANWYPLFPVKNRGL